MIPASATASVSSVVPTGRRMNGAERLAKREAAGPAGTDGWNGSRGVSGVMALHPLRRHDQRLGRGEVAAVAVPISARLPRRRADRALGPGGLATAEPLGEAVEVQVDDRGRVEGQDLAEDQAADDRDAERAAEFGADAAAQG